jgi:hypothetical protein
MKEFKLEIKTTLTVTAEDIDDIVTTAFEGGINYWCNRAEVVGDYLGEFASDQISRGGVVLLYDAENDDVYELTLEKVLKGIQKACEGRWGYDNEWCNGEVIDTYNVDAMVADMIIQLALFDDVIFG